jgi:hypothetical protein
MVDGALAAIEQRVSQPQSIREIDNVHCRIDSCLDDPQVSVRYMLRSWNDQYLFAPADRLEEKSAKGPASECRKRTLLSQDAFSDLADGIRCSRLVYDENVREGNEHVLSNTCGACWKRLILCL